VRFIPLKSRMTEAPGRHLWLLAFLLLCVAGTLLAAWDMRNWGNALSPKAFLHDAGLGNVLFGPRYPTRVSRTPQKRRRRRTSIIQKPLRRPSGRASRIRGRALGASAGSTRDWGWACAG